MDGVDRCVEGEEGRGEGEEEGEENNSLLSAGVPGKEQVRRYPLHCFYSVHLTPVHRGEVRRRRRRKRKRKRRHSQSKIPEKNICQKITLIQRSALTACTSSESFLYQIIPRGRADMSSVNRSFLQCGRSHSRDREVMSPAQMR